MSTLKKMIYSLTAIVIDYHHSQPIENGTQIEPPLEAVEDNTLHSKLNSMINEINGLYHFKRVSLLKYIVAHIKEIKPKLQGNQATIEESLNKLYKLILTFNTLLITSENESIDRQYNDKSYRLIGTFRRGIVTNSQTRSGDFIKNFLKDYGLLESDPKKNGKELRERFFKLMEPDIQISKLETKNKRFKAENKSLKTENEKLKTENEKLKAENESLKSEIAKHSRIRTPYPSMNGLGLFTGTFDNFDPKECSGGPDIGHNL